MEGYQIVQWLGVWAYQPGPAGVRVKEEVGGLVVGMPILFYSSRMR